MIVIFQPLPVVHYLFFGHLLYDFLIYTSKQNFTVFGDTSWGATSLNSDRNVHAIVTNFSQNLGLNKGCTSSIWKKKRNTAWGLMWNSLSHISMYNVLYNVQCTMYNVQCTMDGYLEKKENMKRSGFGMLKYAGWFQNN